MGKMNVCQDIHYVPLRVYTTDTSTFHTPHVNMKLYEKAEFIVTLGALGTANMTLTVTQDSATSGSVSTSAIAARLRATAAAGTDTMGDVQAVSDSGFTVTDGTYDLMTLVIDVDSSDLTVASKPYVGLTFTTGSSASMVSSIGVLLWPKYPKETNDGALT